MTASARKPKTPARKSALPLWLLGIAAAVVIILPAVVLLRPQGPKSSLPVQATLKGKQFNVQLADSNAERQQGLSGQPGLAANEGMLFVFEGPGIECFWMKDMRFSIDILWFDEAKRLVHQERSVAPQSYPRTFCPDKPSRYVMEVQAGTAARLGIEQGDPLSFKVL